MLDKDNVSKPDPIKARCKSCNGAFTEKAILESENLKLGKCPICGDDIVTVRRGPAIMTKG